MDSASSPSLFPRGKGSVGNGLGLGTRWNSFPASEWNTLTVHDGIHHLRLGAPPDPPRDTPGIPPRPFQVPPKTKCRPLGITLLDISHSTMTHFTPLNPTFQLKTTLPTLNLRKPCLTIHDYCALPVAHTYTHVDGDLLVLVTDIVVLAVSVTTLGSKAQAYVN